MFLFAIYAATVFTRIFNPYRNKKKINPFFFLFFICWISMMLFNVSCLVWAIVTSAIIVVVVVVTSIVVVSPVSFSVGIAVAVAVVDDDSDADFSVMLLLLCRDSFRRWVAHFRIRESVGWSTVDAAAPADVDGSVRRQWVELVLILILYFLRWWVWFHFISFCNGFMRKCWVVF